MNNESSALIQHTSNLNHSGVSKFETSYLGYRTCILIFRKMQFPDAQCRQLSRALPSRGSPTALRLSTATRSRYAFQMSNPPELPGLSGVVVRAVRKFRQITNIFPPPGVGIGVGIGLGCGFGWPLRRAYGPPRALCSPMIGFGFGVGYGQGFFGRRFGRDLRSEDFKLSLVKMESALDAVVVRLLVLIGARKAE